MENATKNMTEVKQKKVELKLRKRKDREERKFLLRSGILVGMFSTVLSLIAWVVCCCTYCKQKTDKTSKLMRQDSTLDKSKSRE